MAPSALKNIKVVAMDVDGVLTDGAIVYDADGQELKFFNVKDGYAIVKARRAGIKTAVISARGCKALKTRVRDLKIDKVYLNAYPKLKAYQDMLKAFKVKDEEVCFIGDDLPDHPLLSRVGLAVVPSDAVSEVKRVAHIVTKRPGGRGAVREIIERIMKAQKKWVLAGVLFAFLALRPVAQAADVGYPQGPNSMGGPQQLEGFNLVGYGEGGEKSWDIKGEKADILGDDVDVTNINATSYEGEDANLKARRGQLNKSTGDVHLQDDVVITTERGAQMKTDTLEWYREKDLVRTDDDVVIEDKNMKIQGQGMEARPGLKAAKLQRNVIADIKAETVDRRRENQIQVTCDGPMEIDQAAQIAVFNENVIAIESTTDRTLRADRMEVKFDEKSKKIKEIVCTGNVEVQQANNITYSDMLIYKADEQRMVLKGKPKLILDTGDHTMADALKF